MANQDEQLISLTPSAGLQRSIRSMRNSSAQRVLICFPSNANPCLESKTPGVARLDSWILTQSDGN